MQGKTDYVVCLNAVNYNLFLAILLIDDFFNMLCDPSKFESLNTALGSKISTFGKIPSEVKNVENVSFCGKNQYVKKAPLLPLVSPQPKAMQFLVVRGYSRNSGIKAGRT